MLAAVGDTPAFSLRIRVDRSAEQLEDAVWMGNRINLTGEYVLVNEAFLREKSMRNDPRRDFYVAMLKHRTYEGYLAEVGQRAVEVASHPSELINGRMEILYSRRSGWIEDAAN